MTPSAASANGARVCCGMPGRWGRMMVAAVAGHRLGQHADERDQHNDHGRDHRERQLARRGQELHERRGEQRPDAEPRERDDPVDQRRGARVRRRVQIDEGRSGGAERPARGQSLNRPSHEQPGHRARGGEDERRDEQAEERPCEHGPPADLVRQAAGEQQRDEHPDRVGGVDQRQHRRGEVPAGLVDAVEGGRRGRRVEGDGDDGGDRGERGQARELRGAGARPLRADGEGGGGGAHRRPFLVRFSDRTHAARGSVAHQVRSLN